ncbi:MAG: hypothetical protein KKG47_06365 [Proteobacteria bacterium]|nr:hypothetical protein [Pseudomonadota bacterium]MBU1738433.1 hypothetical protein [Pseudomonadota bacterium]
MRNSYSLVAIILLLSTPTLSVAKNIYLTPGENYHSDGLNVICAANRSSAAEPVVIAECQIWDDFNKLCLHEKKIISAGDLTCTEECQHWDDFSKTCHYTTSCSFDRRNSLFISISCREFDSFTNKCLRTRERKIE